MADSFHTTSNILREFGCMQHLISVYTYCRR